MQGGCQVKIEQERAAGYTLSFLRRVTGQECHLSKGASGVNVISLKSLTQIASQLRKECISGGQEVLKP